MSDPTYALHVAVIAALDEAVSCNVWDAVPAGAEYPYVTVDTIEASNEDFVSVRMDRRFIYLNIWSTHPGQAEVLQIIAEIDALNDRRLELDSGHVVMLKVSRKGTSREPDNLTYMGRVTLELITRH